MIEQQSIELQSIEQKVKFDFLGIDERLLRAVREMGFEEPTLIQEKVIPLVKQGLDIIGQAKTGSGKTAAFGLPILERINPGKGIQALILCPTRELAEQISKEMIKFSKYKWCFVVSIFGGVSINPQISVLPKADVVVGTPGRVLDHINRNTINLTKVKFVVLDEADRMLDMGFIEDVEEILSYLPRQRQTLLFSATIPKEIDSLARKFMNNPKNVVTSTRVERELMEQFYYDVPAHKKFSLLVHLIKKEDPKLAMVFCGTRQSAGAVGSNLQKNGIGAKTLHGGLSQNKRSRFMEDFKSGNIHVLVVTDIAARGLDIKNVTHIFNYDIPRDPNSYIHRIGRTARAGEKGKAISLLSQQDYEFFRAIDTHDNNIQKIELERFPLVPFVRDREKGRFGKNSFFRRSGFEGDFRKGRKGFSFFRRNSLKRDFRKGFKGEFESREFVNKELGSRHSMGRGRDSRRFGRR
ncbi:MAG: DEAD/DEAH box helicase [Nanoarchaeota archaeon]